MNSPCNKCHSPLFFWQGIVVEMHVTSHFNLTPHSRKRSSTIRQRRRCTWAEPAHIWISVNLGEHFLHVRKWDKTPFSLKEGNGWEPWLHKIGNANYFKLKRRLLDIHRYSYSHTKQIPETNTDAALSSRAANWWLKAKPHSRIFSPH